MQHPLDVVSLFFCS